MPSLNPPYSLDRQAVHKVIEAVRSSQSYDEKQFEFYHLHRNVFNVGAEVKSLIKMPTRGLNFLKRFRDNLGNIWTELPTVMNKYHMPPDNYRRSWKPFSEIKPYSRKFVCPDQSIIGGEFEMIIRHDGKRIDGLTNEAWQETYNFGRTLSHPFDHKKLDIQPHEKNAKYKVRKDTGSVKIIE